MIYLNQKTTDYLSLLVETAKSEKKKVLKLGKGKKNPLLLEILSEDTTGIKFCIKLPDDIFSISIFYRLGKMFPYKLVDEEHYPDMMLFSIDEADLSKQFRKARVFHFVFLAFTDALVNSLINYTQIFDKYFDEFEEYSFRTIRFINFLFIAEANIYCSWGVEYMRFEKESVLFKADGHHFKQIVQIQYNRGNDLFNVNFLRIDGILLGGRNSIYNDELIKYIDVKVEHIAEYEDR